MAEWKGGPVQGNLGLLFVFYNAGQLYVPCCHDGPAKGYEVHPGRQPGSVMSGGPPCRLKGGPAPHASPPEPPHRHCPTSHPPNEGCHSQLDIQRDGAVLHDSAQWRWW